jgi:hypothetical protein
MLNVMEVDVMKHARFDLENKLKQRDEEVMQLEVERCEVRSNILSFFVYVFQLPIHLFSLSC